MRIRVRDEQTKSQKLHFLHVLTLQLTNPKNKQDIVQTILHVNIFQSRVSKTRKIMSLIKFVIGHTSVLICEVLFTCDTNFVLSGHAKKASHVSAKNSESRVKARDFKISVKKCCLCPITKLRRNG